MKCHQCKHQGEPQLVSRGPLDYMGCPECGGAMSESKTMIWFDECSEVSEEAWNSIKPQHTADQSEPALADPVEPST